LWNYWEKNLEPHFFSAKIHQFCQIQKFEERFLFIFFFLSIKMKMKA
jgi:hypothetical protein